MIRSRLSEILKQKGMTTNELIQRTGLARETVFRAKRATIASCSLATLEKIATVLGVKVKDLFDEL